MRRDGGWLSRRSFRSRITLSVVAAVGLSVALCALIGYLAISRTIMNRMDDQLEQRATVFTAMPLEMFSPAYLDAARELLASSGYQESLVYADGTSHQPQNLQLQRLGPDGRPGEILATYQVWAPFGPPEVAVAAHQGQTSLRTLNYNGVDYRVYAIHNTYADGSPDSPQPSALVFSTSLAPTESALNTIATISVVVGLLGIGLAAFAGLTIGRGALRPVVRLSQATEWNHLELAERVCRINQQYVQVARHREMLISVIKHQDFSAKLAYSPQAALIAVFVDHNRNVRQRAREHQRLVAELAV